MNPLMPIGFSGPLFKMSSGAIALASEYPTSAGIGNPAVLLAIVAGVLAVGLGYACLRIRTLQASYGELQEDAETRVRQARASTSSIPGVTYHSSPDEQRKALYLSEQFVALTGYPVHDFTGEMELLLSDLYLREYADKVDFRIREAINSREHYKIEYRIRCKDGTTRWVADSGRPVQDEEGRVTHLEGFLFDISQQKATEAELKKLSMAVDQSPVSVLITDIDGHIEYINPTFTCTTGYTSDEVVGKNPRIFSSRKQHGSFYKNLWGTILSGNIWTGDFENKKKNGELYWAQTAIAPVMSKHGKVTHFVAVSEDISERKMMEVDLRGAKVRAEAANLAKSTFLANMSHEIRTPLNAILGYAQLLGRDKKLEASQKKQVNTILNSGQHLLHLINDILDMSKIEAGQTELHLAAMDIGNLLNEIDELFRVHPGNADVDFRLECAGSLPDAVYCDERKLRQVLINLVGNAIKFTHAGTVKLAVSAEDCTAGNEPMSEITFSVEDTGVGISREDILRIFKPFERTKYSMEFKEGTGLGLAITNSFIGIMGGKLEVESKLGEGSRFFFTIRTKMMDPLHDKNTGPRPRDVLTLLPQYMNTHILLVEDNETSRKMLKNFLGDVGFDVSIATNGKEAVEFCRKYHPDLILMDLKMPEMDGYKASSIIKKDNQFNDVPIVAATASIVEVDMTKLIKYGMTEMIQKPFRLNELLDLIKRRLKIDYAYRLQEKSDAKQSVPPALNREAIAFMAETDRDELLSLVTQGHFDGVNEKLKKFEPDCPEVIAALRDKLDAFAYDELIELLSSPVTPETPLAAQKPPG